MGSRFERPTVFECVINDDIVDKIIGVYTVQNLSTFDGYTSIMDEDHYISHVTNNTFKSCFRSKKFIMENYPELII